MYVYPLADGGWPVAGGGLWVFPELWRGAFDPIGFIPGAVLMNAAHSHYPHPFDPAGFIAGAVLMDATAGGAA